MTNQTTAPKRGRPPIAPEQRRSVHYGGFCLVPAEAAIFDRYRAQGYTIADFIRYALKDMKAKEKEPPKE